jgi:hypothetical protein
MPGAFCIQAALICIKQTGMLPAPPPTNCYKSSGLSDEADTQQKNLYNKKAAHGR